METINQNNDNIVFPDAAHEYHGHPNYGRVLFTLLALLSLSLVIGYIFSPALAITFIFATAVWKTALVMRNFMHLKYEPLFLFIVIAAVLLILFAFFMGVYPDITAVPRDVTLPH
ncbi:MAG: cytochrome C oxidase subunit IV family protein [Bacteroidia bacterium]|jgi:caa(3)-type oxidase subunit IV|nr:cytochrome C oxidase subunit IV family protein [Bacteroidia bacterium]